MYAGTVLLFLSDLGGGEIFIILIAVLLLFGADKIPNLARSLGRGMREFKDATNEIKSELERHVEDIKKPD